MLKQFEKNYRMKTSLSFFLAFVLLVGVFTLPLSTAQGADKKYGRVQSDNTNVAQLPGGSVYILKLPKDWVVEILEMVTQDGISWQKISSKDPYAPTDTNVYSGYILNGYLTELSAEEGRLWESNPVQPVVQGNSPVVNNPVQAQNSVPEQVLTTSNSNFTTYTVGTVNSSGTNIRVQPWGGVIAKVNRGTVLEVFSVPSGNTDNDWYGVRYGEYYGYIQAPYFTLNTGTVLPTPFEPKPTNIPYSDRAVGFVKVTKGGANLRDSVGGKTMEQLKRNTLLPYISKPIFSNRYTWYEVITAGGTRGFLRSDVVEITSQGGSSGGGGSIVVPPVVTQAPDTSTIYGTVTVTKSNSNLRETPGGSTITQIAKGTSLNYYQAPISSGGYNWYYVQAPNGRFGYLRSDVVNVSSQIDVTPAPMPTQGPIVTQPPVVPGSYGTITLIKNNVNLRNTPNGSSLTQLKRNTTHTLIGNPVSSGRYTWYPIQASGYTGYIRGDMVNYTPGSGSVNPPVITNGPIVTNPPSVTGNYVKITKPGVNVRNSPGGKTIGQVKRNTIWPMTGNSIQAVGYIWYPINANGLTGYVRGDVSYQMSPKEVEDYLNGKGGSATQSPVQPTTPPVVGSQYVLTKEDNVELKVIADGSGIVLDTLKKNVALPHIGTSTIAGEVWYNVSHTHMGHTYSLWVPATKVQTMTYQEYQNWLLTNTTPAPTATPNPNVTPTPVPTGGPPEATYNILRKGARGEEVSRMQARLKELGYYTATISGYYDTAVYNAVRNYQKAYGLKVDGVAGPNTLHSLYGTVPPGTTNPGGGGSGSGDFVLYPVERVDWTSGVVDKVWAKGATAQIKDVRTGKTFTLQRLYGGAHIDAEPLTAADTAVICQLYGVSSASQMTENKHYQKRPLWVTVGGRTFAASLYAVPHGSQSILNNNFPGQLCVHFLNSRTHGSNIIHKEHTAAVNEAYNAAPQKK